MIFIAHSIFFLPVGLFYLISNSLFLCLPSPCSFCPTHWGCLSPWIHSSPALLLAAWHLVASDYILISVSEPQPCPFLVTSPIYWESERVWEIIWAVKRVLCWKYSEDSRKATVSEVLTLNFRHCCNSFHLFSSELWLCSKMEMIRQGKGWQWEMMSGSLTAMRKKKIIKRIHANSKIKQTRVVFGDFYNKRKVEAMSCGLFIFEDRL